MVNSYIFYPAKRFDVRGKRLLKLHEKYHAVDMGMRRMVLPGQIRDEGRILENLVFLELMRRYPKVYVGKVNDAEIDFVTEGADGFAYYQVVETVTSQKGLERELHPFSIVQDNSPKYLLTMDDVNPVSHKGINQINAID